jgi:hypothetical protein|tara:strand:+ start:937 stop:1065 length:129 start_codon:yes stop_codon:yes gene_type:complete
MIKTPKMIVLQKALNKAGLDYAVFKEHGDKMVTINVWIGEKE